MLVFGGDQRGGQRADVWALDLESDVWARVETGPGPAPVSDLAEILDVARDRWIFVGGRRGLGRSIDEVWSLDLATNEWTQHAPGPSARHDVSGATDGSRAWVFGGAGALAQSQGDLWELDLATMAWRVLPAPGDHPIARTSYAWAFHEGFLYLHGGHDVARAFSDTWRYDLAQERWERLEVEGGAAANAHTAHALDDACGAMIMSGGDNLDGFVTGTSAVLALGAHPRMIRLPASALPTPRDHASLVLDPVRRRLVFYGGGALGEGLDTFEDAWAYPLGACL